MPCAVPPRTWPARTLLVEMAQTWQRLIEYASASKAAKSGSFHSQIEAIKTVAKVLDTGPTNPHTILVSLRGSCSAPDGRHGEAPMPGCRLSRGLFQMREQVCFEAARVACLSYREPGTGRVSILKWDLA